ncbi:CocE/NonD family hydrolase [Actinoplanes sp. HUAS TT8]|uniref:CocE/NonD family hydrolase n=1 Tax=Actinoplanes sp. HUAS TT8 TaxID=3447453 RepID=UPI003F526A50
MKELPWSLRMLRRRTRKGPAARYDVRWEPAVPVPGADGTTLLTDHYAPVTTEPCPTVLIRAPYIRGGFPWNWLFGVLFAEQGYHVLMQSSRGLSGSTGEFVFWHNDGPDGQASVEWLRKQEFFTGDLYTVGGSYMAYSQLALAERPPPEWRAAVIQIAVADPHRFYWTGGQLALERSLVGGLIFAQSRTFRASLGAMARMQMHLRGTLRRVPLIDAYPSLFGGRRRPDLESVISSPSADDPYWAGADKTDFGATLPIPVSLSTGWHDLAPEQTIELYQRRRAAGLETDLMIGPWTHTNGYERDWERYMTQALRRLRGGSPELPVLVHVGGADEWRELPDWPPPGVRPHRFHLGPAALTLSPGPGSSRFRYDPEDPTPSIGGALQSPTQGTRDMAELERRDDVLVFTSPPLTGAVEVMGPVRATFDATTSAADGDLFARLCDVDPSGKSINICDGLARITPDGPTAVELGPTAHRFRTGHRIRLLVAGGSYPRWMRNYGTGEPAATATRMVAGETTVQHSSTLELTVV